MQFNTKFDNRQAALAAKMAEFENGQPSGMTATMHKCDHHWRWPSGSVLLVTMVGESFLKETFVHYLQKRGDGAYCDIQGMMNRHRANMKRAGGLLDPRPENVDTSKWRVNLAAARALDAFPDPQKALQTIIANCAAQRPLADRLTINALKIETRAALADAVRALGVELPDMLDEQPTAVVHPTSSFRIRPGFIYLETKLSSDVTMVDDKIVVRRNVLPDLVLQSLIGQSIARLVEHPAIPGALIIKSIRGARTKDGGVTYTVTVTGDVAGNELGRGALQLAA